MERFFYSIIASCLLEFLASRSLTLSISKQDDSVHTISLLTGGHRSCRIPPAAGGEEVQRWCCRRRRGEEPMRTVLLDPALARTKILHALVRCRRVGRSCWYVSNVSIIFDCSMLYYPLFWMFMGFIIHFYIIFGTNLLTQSPVPVFVYSLF